MKQYEVSPGTAQKVEKAFLAKPLSQDQVQRIEKVDERLGQLARQLAQLTPECAEQTTMIDRIREVGFWAREAIHKNEL